MRNYNIFQQYITKLVNNDESLKYVDLSSYQLDDEALDKILEALKSNTNLETVNLSDNNIGESCINKLTSITKLKINLEKNQIKPQTLPSSNLEPTSFSKSSQYFNRE